MAVAFDKSVRPQMTALLEVIEKNDVGKVIIDLIKKSDKTATFRPLTAGDIAAHGECYADCIVDPKAAAASGTPMESIDRVGGKKTQVTGTGEGSDAVIRFNPNYPKACERRGPGALADEVVLHEMVHALRGMLGIRFQHRVDIPADFVNLQEGYTNEEEFLAIVVTNVYTSRAGRPRLRAGHYGYEVLPASLSTSADFIKDPIHNKLLNIYRLVWSDVFTKLSVIPAPFNPFAELARNLARTGGSITLKNPIYPEGKAPWWVQPRLRGLYK